MKNKFIVLLFIVVLFILVGCGNEEEKDEKIEVKYNEVDLMDISLTINDKDITIDLSLNTELKELLLSIELYKIKNIDDVNERNSKYTLYFGDYEFTIYDDKSICYIDSENEYDYLYALNNEFDYLDTLFDANVLDFSKYSDTQVIKLFNSQNDVMSIEDKVDFLNNLKLIKFFELYNSESYNIGNLIYKIQIDEEVIEVYSDYIVIEDNLYMILEGSFTFLNNIKFNSSSGWLPWI